MSSNKKPGSKKTSEKRSIFTLPDNIGDVDLLFGKIRAAAMFLSISLALGACCFKLPLVIAIILGILSFVIFAAMLGYEMLMFKKARAMVPKKIKGQPLKRCGIFNWFQNKTGALADIALLAFCFMFAAFLLLGMRSRFVWALTGSAFLYPAQIHCLYNGRVYNTLKNNE